MSVAGADGSPYGRGQGARLFREGGESENHGGGTPQVRPFASPSACSRQAVSVSLPVRLGRGCIVPFSWNLRVPYRSLRTDLFSRIARCSHRKKNEILARDVCQKAAEAEALLQRAERNRAAASKSQEAADAAGKALVVVSEV